MQVEFESDQLTALQAAIDLMIDKRLFYFSLPLLQKLQLDMFNAQKQHDKKHKPQLLPIYEHHGKNLIVTVGARQNVSNVKSNK